MWSLNLQKTGRTWMQQTSRYSDLYSVSLEFDYYCFWYFFAFLSLNFTKEMFCFFYRTGFYDFGLFMPYCSYYSAFYFFHFDVFWRLCYINVQCSYQRKRRWECTLNPTHMTHPFVCLQGKKKELLSIMEDFFLERAPWAEGKKFS